MMTEELNPDTMPTNKKGYMSKYYQENKEKFNNPKERKKRAARNKARRMMEKEGRVHKGDGKDVSHRKPLRSGGANTRSNLMVLPRSKNRADNGKSKKSKK